MSLTATREYRIRPPSHPWGFGEAGSVYWRAMNVLDLLPHRPPMRLLEDVVSVTPGKEAVGRRFANGNDFYFQGHFPGDPIVPAVILIEMVAQAGGLAVGAPGPGEDARQPQLRVAAIGPFKFPAPARPGAVLEASARVAGALGGLHKIDGAVTADGVIVATGSLTLAG
jgi:3-hydroxyacyl-[acyl-carrier-protein] dehydratase